jgi:1,4-alpha-glucan branching enzyme
MRGNFRIGVPRAGFWKEVLNTNSEYYGGSGAGNEGGRMAEEIPCNGYSYSLNLTIPPLTTLMFKWTIEG